MRYPLLIHRRFRPDSSILAIHFARKASLEPRSGVMPVVRIGLTPQNPRIIRFRDSSDGRPFTQRKYQSGWSTV
jgi:hypothetical protein